MFNRDCVRFPHAFAKAAAHRRVSAATTEQHTYQITLILASDNTLHFDLGAWRRLIEEHHGSLELAADQASFECDCPPAVDDAGYVRTSRGLLPWACTHARPEAFHGRLYPGGDGANGHRNRS